MNWIDITIIILFLSGITAYGIYSGRFNKTTEDYFLGGRNLPWVVALFSIVATETSVLTFVSVPGMAYRGDWTFLQLAMGYILGRVIVSIYLLPKFYNSGVTSIYEVIGERFSPSVQKAASSVFLVTRLLADGIRYLATAVVVQAVTGWPIWAAVLLIGVVTLIYTLSGGIRTVMWIDSFQFILYLGGGLLAIFFSLQALDGSIPEIITSLSEAGKTKVFRLGWDWFSDPWLFGSAFIGGSFLSFASHGADHMMVQRVLGTRDLRSAKKAMIGSGFFVLLQFFIFLLVGSLIYLQMGGVEIQKDREFTTFITTVLPVGVRGLLLAGILSAAMSTLSSSINALASSTVIDWFGKNASLALSKMFSVFWAIVLIIIALVFDEGDSAIVIVGLQIASFTYGGLLGLFILTKLNRNFSSPSLIVGLIGSLVAVFILKSNGLAWTWFIAFSTLTNIGLTFLVDSLLNRKK
ncbi:MAG: sodium:solute symporter [Candidatus Marinimicrobia bacterium]|nr:sodium:solute symporter [Candidatus Neomarinimicrobiota bacterium]